LAARLADREARGRMSRLDGQGMRRTAIRLKEIKT
jgi:hypothetical protein